MIMENKITLWQISQHQQQVNAMLEENGGELTEEIIQMMDENNEALEIKGAGYIHSMRYFAALEETAKAEKERIYNIEKAAKKAQESLKTRLHQAMQVFGIDKLDLGTAGKVSYRRSESVIVEDVNNLDRAFCKVKLEADKVAIKAAIKAGQEVQGAYIEEKLNLNIR
jgi:glutamate-1-semialdehyde aminotransferase